MCVFITITSHVTESDTVLGSQLSITWHYVLVEDVHIVAPVWSRVFVPESDHVTQFVDHYAELVTVLAYRDRLRSAATLPDERTTSTPIMHRHYTFAPESHSGLACLFHDT